MNTKLTTALDSIQEHWLTVDDASSTDAGYWLAETDRHDWSLLRLALCVGLALTTLALAVKLLS